MAPVRPAIPARPPSLPQRPVRSHGSAPRGIWFQRVLAVLLLVAASPLILLVALLVRISDGRPILYRGTRLGRNRAPFTILKFRTLKRGSQAILGGALHNDTQGLTIRFGRVLRACRLDELPQLVNVIRGDMNLWGPRPERPEVYETQCRNLLGYERRFQVAPGLIGWSQLFTPHGTPKSFRTRLDNAMLASPPSALRQLGVVAFTAWCTVRTGTAGLVQWCRDDLLRSRLLRRRRQLRSLKRVRPRGAEVRLEPDEMHGTGIVVPSRATQPIGSIVDLNERYICFRGETELRGDRSWGLTLRVPVCRHGRLGYRSARCIATVSETRNGGDRLDTVVRYEPRDSYSDYVLHQYFLRSSLASPARPVRRVSRTREPV